MCTMSVLKNMNTQEFIVAVKVSNIHNRTFLGQVLDSQINNSTVMHQVPYDHAGAVYYILAVIFMYSCSILMMIGSFARKSKHDTHMSTYMKDMEMVGKMELKQEKFRTKLQMHQKKVNLEFHLIIGLFFHVPFMRLLWYSLFALCPRYRIQCLLD